MAKRFFDLMFSLFGLIILSPFFLIISLCISIHSKGGVYYIQKRVGKHGKEFNIIKFRTMFAGAENKGLLTIGNQDSRITKPGKWLRKRKLDELPQLINILKGEMSFVGPRPEVRKYVNLYNPEQKMVLSVRPGLTDYASLVYINESEVLASHGNPEKAYTEKIMQEKLALNLKYLQEKGLLTDVKIIVKTLGKIAG
jgi:lipopolysaccharide/colanic/teichoic acid biosynthesis glycosyltransferase